MLDKSKFEHLRGVTITVSDAAKKYLVCEQTIRRWVEQQVIAILSQITPKRERPMLLDEADVAFSASVFKHIGGQGKRTFDQDGQPYKRRFEDVALYRQSQSGQ